MRAHWIMAAAVASVASAATAGTFKTISIDGDFADWADVPDAVVDASGDGNPIDFGAVQIANDADNLYIRINYVTPVNPNIGPSLYFAFDTDNNVATGFNIYGLNTVGSEAGFQNDFPFDQRTGFNVGGLSAPGSMLPVDWGNPAAGFTSQEYTFPRNLAYSSDSAPVFNNPSFTLMLWTDSSVAVDVTSGINYAFASPIPAWKNDTSGDWNDSANWTFPTPNAIGATAVFGSAITTAQTVFNNAAVTCGNLEFDNAHQYVLGGTGSLTLDVASGNANVTVKQGSHKINLPTTVADTADFVVWGGATLNIADPLTIAAGMTFNKLGGGVLDVNGTVTGGAGTTFIAWEGNTNLHTDLGANIALQSSGGTTTLFATQHVGGVNLAAGTVKIDAAGAAKVLKTSGLTLAGGTLDVGDNAVIVTNASALADIKSAIIAGYAAGAWTGVGIISGGADSAHAVGYALASQIGSPPTFVGEAFSGAAVLVRYTLRGDSNLSGKVDFDDLLALAQNYGLSGKSWVEGDNNYSGTVDFDDLLALAQNYNLNLSVDQLASLDSGFAADWQLARSLVPEPGVLGLIGALGFAGRRRSRR